MSGKRDDGLDEAYEWYKKSLDQPVTIRFLPKPIGGYHHLTQVHKLRAMVCPICEIQKKPKKRFRSIDDEWQPS